LETAIRTAGAHPDGDGRRDASGHLADSSFVFGEVRSLLWSCDDSDDVAVAMAQDDREIITALVVEACRQMLASNGEPFEEQPEEGPAGDWRSLLAATVGLSGLGVRGALVVAGRSPFFRQSYPPELGVPGDAQLVDWAGEMANRLLGRIKNRVAAHGLDFSLSMPTVVRGYRVHLQSTEQALEVRRRFAIQGEVVDVYFDIERNDGGALLAPNGSPTSSTLEGDGVLF
jgi:chemotaxis phosphatase CheX-like protein